MSSENVPKNVGIYKHVCTSLGAPESTAAFWKDLRVRAGSLPNPPELQPLFSLAEAALSAPTQEQDQAGLIPATQRHAARGRWPSFSCRFPGWHRFRGRPWSLCGADGAPARLPLARPSEGRDCFIYEMGGKNKAPVLFFHSG